MRVPKKGGAYYAAKVWADTINPRYMSDAAPEPTSRTPQKKNPPDVPTSSEQQRRRFREVRLHYSTIGGFVKMDILEVRDTIFWWVGCWTIITAADYAALSLALRIVKRNRRHWITPKEGGRND